MVRKTSTKTQLTRKEPKGKKQEAKGKKQEGFTTKNEKKTNVKAKKNKGVKTKLKQYFKIDKLPKSVQESIPFRGVMANGIIETYPGTFTKTLRLRDVNFSIAPEAEQARIFKAYMGLLNSMSKGVKWQFTIYNHEIDKKETLREIRIPSRKDKLVEYRNEMNSILISNLAKGSNGIRQEKYLTLAVEENDAEQAVRTLNHLEGTVNTNIRKITNAPAKSLELNERLELLYGIYNQDTDYRLATGLDKNGDEVFDVRHVARQGASIKDMIGPASFDFRKGNMFKMGDTYGRVFFLKKVPTYLSTDFIVAIGELQNNLIISITSETIDSEEAMKLVTAQLSNIEAQVAGKMKKNAEEGYGDSLPPKLEKAQDDARDLMDDLTSRNQNVFFLTMSVCLFAKTEAELEDVTKSLKRIASNHLAPLEVLHEQQEQGLNTVLPLCRNDLFADIMYTTEGAAVFIPYNSQEINQKNAIFYGLNQMTKSMIMYDRMSADNYNGLIFGMSGSGKSFAAKNEIVQVLLRKPNAQVFILDPQGEYYPLCDGFGGERIRVAPKSGIYINPLDLDMSSDEEEGDPVTNKADFLFSMLEIMIGKNRQLDPEHRTLLDRCVRKIYRPYIEYINNSDGITFNPMRCPQLSDLYEELRSYDDDTAKYLADILEMYVSGSFDTFGHRTNVRTNSRLVVYDIKNLGSGMKELGLHVCLNDVWNRMIANSKNNICTYVYIDEFHLLLELPSTTLVLKRIWKMARKWLGVPTGIMQNTEDLLRDADSRNIINNSSFIMMLKEPEMDRANLQTLLELSKEQLDYITESERGTGLLYNGKVVLPFSNEFPKDTKLYAAMTTSHDTDKPTFK